MAETLREITLDDIQEIIGRAMLDSTFREILLGNPDTTLRIMGLRQTPESINFFRALATQAFNEAAEEIDNRLGARPVIGAWL